MTPQSTLRNWIYHACVLLTMLAMGGCARSVPLISHAHLGHAVTGWHDTPQQRGLFVVAEQEMTNAESEVALARIASDTPALAKIHVKNVLHSLNPDLQTNGTGSGYGGVRAVQGSIDHVKFAALSEDASQNLRQSTVDFEAHAQAMLDQLLITVGAARLTLAADDLAFSSDLETLERAMDHSANGKDLDNDGVIGNQVGESGLRQLRVRLSTLLGNEVAPPYHPVGRRYLFGLVKLPNGRWDYRFNRSGYGDEGSEGGSGGSGY